MSKIDVEKGDFVQTGDKIGEVGSSGRSTGNHLHWGVAWYKKRLNPSLLLKPQEEFLVFKSRTPDTLKIAKK
jgi:murein DD-endopeptidase MepM/ murein hydrolase activator NlpD